MVLLDRDYCHLRGIYFLFVSHSVGYPLVSDPVQPSQDTVFDFLVASTKEDEELVESHDPWRRFEHHAQILKSHEERLENNITKIEIIREMLEQRKGTFSLHAYVN